ncbi:hypothetical protein EHQ74_06250 [Leptospira levettii]|uniref:AsmA family protein n=2 Tax=Leptospira levettii TaxID=2023178 RepID=A0ABY2ML97_9LEPT|nr:hypothetical protein EHQ60_12545 [Leptospira levettii]TGM28946.1 hypothetical protein EHQ74_06250 [Leptospira levettii]
MMNPILKSSLGIAKTKSFRGLFVLFLLYKLVFNHFTANWLVPHFLSQYTLVKMEGKFTSFSLLYGIEIQDLKLYPGGPFASDAFFRAKEIRIRYNLPFLFLGKIRFSDISLIDSNIRIEEKKGEWNVSHLLKPNPKQEEKPKKEIGPPLTEINTYLPLQLTAHLNLQGVSLQYIRESGNIQYASIQNFDFQTKLITNRFTSIPLNIDAINQLDEVMVHLNSERPLSIEFKSNQLNWKETLPMSLRFEWDRTESPELFLFATDIGKDKFNLDVRGKQVQTGFRLLSDIHFDPKEDLLKIQQFDLRVIGQTWLKLGGVISKLSTETPEVNVDVETSELKLDDLQSSLNQLEGIVPFMKVSGDLSLAGTGIHGNWNQTKANLKLLANKVYVKIGNQKPHALDTANLDLTANLDFASEKEPTTEIPFPKLKSLTISPSQLNYNQSEIRLSGEYSQSSGFQVLASLEKLQLAEYSQGIAGKVKLALQSSADSFANIHVNSNINIDGFRYQIDRSRSPASHLNLDINTHLIFDRPFGIKEIQIQNLILDQRTLTGNKAIELQLKGYVKPGDTLNAQVSPLDLKLNTPNLLLVLPLVLKEKISPVQNLLGQQPKIKLNASYVQNPGSKHVNANLSADLPGLEMKDLKLTTDLTINGTNSNEILIKQMKVNAFSGVLKTSLSGKLVKLNKPKPPLGPYFGNLDLNVSVVSPSKQYLAKGISVHGDLGLNLKINDYDINGELFSKLPSLSYNNQKCPGESCKAYLMEEINAKIPIQHDLAFKPDESLIIGDKSIFIKNYGRMNTPNVTIGRVIGTHPNIPNLPFEYVKKQKDSPGFSAFIEYKENFANIESLKSFSMDGIILGKNLVFNLGNLDPKNMEFRGNLLIRDIDLKQLMAPKVRDKIDDGKLKADLNIKVRDLSEPIANLDLFFSIFQIGRDFGKSALNVISAQNFFIDRITDSYPISKIDISLSRGLVYADVYFDRSLLSLIMKLEDGKISQQRMPLANFLKRAQNEIQTYQE